MAHRIPTRVRLPFGIIIRIFQVTRREMCTLGWDGCDGGWDPTDKRCYRIYLVRSLPRRLKRHTLMHELKHALVDITDHLLEDKVSGI